MEKNNKIHKKDKISGLVIVGVGLLILAVLGYFLFEDFSPNNNSAFTDSGGQNEEQVNNILFGTNVENSGLNTSTYANNTNTTPVKETSSVFRPSPSPNRESATETNRESSRDTNINIIRRQSANNNPRQNTRSLDVSYFEPVGRLAKRIVEIKVKFQLNALRSEFRSRRDFSWAEQEVIKIRERLDVAADQFLGQARRELLDLDDDLEDLQEDFEDRDLDAIVRLNNIIQSL